MDIKLVRRYTVPSDTISKREAIKKAYVQLTDDNKAKWQNNQTLLDWLENL